MWIARDNVEGNQDYWLAIEPFDRDADPEDGSVSWMPYEGSSCASIGPKLWEAMGGPVLDPGEDQREVSVKFSFGSKSQQS